MKHLSRILPFLALACLGSACASSTKGDGASDALALTDAAGADVPNATTDVWPPGAEAPDLSVLRPDTGALDLAAPRPDTTSLDLPPSSDVATFKSDTVPDLATLKLDTVPDLTTPKPDISPDLAAPKPDTSPDLVSPRPDVTPETSPPLDALATRCFQDGSAPALVHLSPLELKTILDSGEDLFLINVKGASIGQIPDTDATLVGDIAGIEALVGSDTCANIVLYCLSGGTSQNVGAQLIAKGYRRVRDLSGGITAWKAAGYPTL